jgi:hypothetical protein
MDWEGRQHTTMFVFPMWDSEVTFRVTNVHLICLSTSTTSERKYLLWKRTEAGFQYESGWWAFDIKQNIFGELLN